MDKNKITEQEKQEELEVNETNCSHCDCNCEDDAAKSLEKRCLEYEEKLIKLETENKSTRILAGLSSALALILLLFMVGQDFSNKTSFDELQSDINRAQKNQRSIVQRFNNNVKIENARREMAEKLKKEQDAMIRTEIDREELGRRIRDITRFNARQTRRANCLEGLVSPFEAGRPDGRMPALNNFNNERRRAAEVPCNEPDRAPMTKGFTGKSQMSQMGAVKQSPRIVIRIADGMVWVSDGENIRALDLE